MFANHKLQHSFNIKKKLDVLNVQRSWHFHNLMGTLVFVSWDSRTYNMEKKGAKAVNGAVPFSY